MKLLKMFAILFIASTFILTGCDLSSDSDDTKSTVDGNNDGGSTTATYIGTWFDSTEGNYTTFNSDMSYEVVSVDSSSAVVMVIKGTYTYADNTIVMTATQISLGGAFGAVADAITAGLISNDMVTTTVTVKTVTSTSITVTIAGTDSTAASATAPDTTSFLADDSDSTPVAAEDYVTDFSKLSDGTAVAAVTYTGGDVITYENGVILTVGSSSTGSKVSASPKTLDVTVDGVAASYTFANRLSLDKTATDTTLTVPVEGNCTINIIGYYKLDPIRTIDVLSVPTDGATDKTTYNLASTDPLVCPFVYTGPAGNVVFHSATGTGAIYVDGVVVDYAK